MGETPMLRVGQLLEHGQEGLTVSGEVALELLGAVAVGAGPGLLAVEIAALGAGVGVLDANKLEILFPIRPFFLERLVAEADLDPFDRAITVDARISHVAEVFGT